MSELSYLVLVTSQQHVTILDSLHLGTIFSATPHNSELFFVRKTAKLPLKTAFPFNIVMSIIFRFNNFAQILSDIALLVVLELLSCQLSIMEIDFFLLDSLFLFKRYLDLFILDRDINI